MSEARRAAGRRLAWTLLAAAAYAAAVAYLSWPLLSAPATTLVDPQGLPNPGGVWGRADLDLLVWILGWTSHALAMDPARVFQANIFHPAPDALASSEHLLGLAPLAAPVFWSTGNAVLAYNVTVLAVVWLAALCTFLLVHDWTGSAAAALLAGAAFAFGPQLTGSFVRLHVSAVHLFPLVLLLAWRCARAPRLLTLVLLAAVTALQLASGVYVAFELVALLVAFVPFLLLEAWRARHAGLALVGALACGAAVVAPLALPYLRVREAGRLPGLPEALAAVAATAPSLGQVAAWLVRDLTAPVVALALVGVVRSRRVPLHLRAGLVAIAVLGVVLSAGTTLPIVPGGDGPSLYELAMRFLPGFSGMRASGRFIVLPLLAGSVLAGIGAAELCAVVRDRFATRGVRVARAVLVAGAALLVVARGVQPPLPVAAVPLGGLRNAAYAWLAEQPEPGAVLELPVMNSGMDGRAVLATGRYMVGSTLHFRPLVNGYSGHPPALAALTMTLAQRLPDAEAYRALCEIAAPRFLVVHFGLMPGEEERWRDAAPRLGLEEAARFGRDVVYLTGEACAETSRRPLREATLGATPLRPLDASERRATLRAEIPPEMPAASFRWLWIEVQNDGDGTWPGYAGARRDVVGLATRWRDPRTGRVVAEGELTPLGRDLAPGETMRAQVSCVAPREPGTYLLEVGLAQHERGWLADLPGPEPGRAGLLAVPVRVTAR